MRNWEFCLNSVQLNEKSGMARIFSIDPGYLETIGGRFRVVMMGWGLEVFGPMRSDDLRQPGE